MYKCGWNGCEKAYGTLNHLNAHVTMQSHGAKRTPEGWSAKPLIPRSEVSACARRSPGRLAMRTNRVQNSRRYVKSGRPGRKRKRINEKPTKSDNASKPFSNSRPTPRTDRTTPRTVPRSRTTSHLLGTHQECANCHPSDMRLQAGRFLLSMRGSRRQWRACHNTHRDKFNLRTDTLNLPTGHNPIRCTNSVSSHLLKPTQQSRMALITDRQMRMSRVVSPAAPKLDLYRSFSLALLPGRVNSLR